MIRLEVPLSSSIYRPRPGTFFYLSVLRSGDSNFWESHPFTVASTSNFAQEAVVHETTPLLDEERYENTHVQSQQGALTSDLETEYMTFLIRPYDGFTSRLRDVAEAQWPKPATVRIAVDGPYGRMLPLLCFHHIVFVVGGSGIVVPLSYIRQLTSFSAGRPRVIHIHWTVRQPALAAEILHEPDMRRALKGSEKVRMNVYLTGGDDVVEGTCNDVPDEGRVKWSYGRIDAVSAVKEAVDEAANFSLAVVACGPARMADDTRGATVEGMRDSKCRRIEYFEEGFQW
jgi:predicted ferric reductase